MRTIRFLPAVCFLFFLVSGLDAQVGKVGINTTTPAAMLHVMDSSVVFTGPPALPANPGPPPVSGQGVRMMWYPDKAAFRVGGVPGGQWDNDSIGDYSIVLGFNSLASAQHAIAIGDGNKATGSFSFAAGVSNRAIGSGSFTFGNNTRATRPRAGAIGFRTEARGGNSFAAGQFTRADGSCSFAIGRNNVGGGYWGDWIDTDPVFEIGMGVDTNNRRNAMTIFKNAGALWGGEYNGASPAAPPASGEGTRMMWYPDKASFRAGRVTGSQWDVNETGPYSTAFGFNTLASGSGASAFGGFTKAEALDAMAIGAYNVGGGTAGNWIATDPLLEVGIGTSAADPRNALTILKNGKVGIGTHTPGNLLHVFGGDAEIEDYYPYLFLNDTTAGDGGAAGLGFQHNGVNKAILSYNVPNDYIKLTTDDSGTRNDLVVSDAGNIGIGTNNPGDKVHINGGDIRLDDTYPFLWLNSTQSGANAGILLGQNGVNKGGLLYHGNQDVIRLTSDPNAIRNDLAISPAGKVGIGTSLPEEALHVEGTIEVDQKIQANDAGGLEFATDEGTTRMVILDDGDIGIGSATPPTGTRLYVNGGDITVDDANAWLDLNATTATGTSGVSLQQTGTQKGSIGYSDAYDILRITTDPLGVRGDIAVASTGKVGVGTSFPYAHQLAVVSDEAGPAGATGYIVNSAYNGIALSVENASATSNDNVLLVTTQGSTGNLASFDSFHGTGSWDREFRFTNTGDGRCDGSWITGGADYAEFFPMAYPESVLEPGDVIAISEARGYSVEKATAAKSRLVLGVYSTMPAVIGNSSAEEDPEDAALVGLIGVVPTKVCLEQGPIRIGDFVTISSTPGVAARAVSSGMMIGRAMENFDGPGQGMIKVMVDIGHGTIDEVSELASLRSEIQELRAMISGHGSK